MRRTFGLGISMLLFLILLTGCNEETQTNIPSGGHGAPVKLEFSSLENFLTAHRAVNAGEDIYTLVEFWIGRNSSATFADTIERLGFASLERLYLPTGIPETHQLFRITVFECTVEFWYLPEAYLVTENPIRLSINPNRDFIFNFSRDREWDLRSLMRQNRLTEDDLINNKYLLFMPDWLWWESDMGKILRLTVPQSVAADNVADMARFAEITVVDLQNKNMTADKEELLDYAAFLALLEINGFMFEEGGDFSANPFSGGGASHFSVRIGDDRLAIYEYESNEAMACASRSVSRCGNFFGGDSHSTPPHTAVTWNHAPYFFKRDLIIVFYTGENEQIINFLMENLTFFAGWYMVQE